MKVSVTGSKKSKDKFACALSSIGGRLEGKEATDERMNVDTGSGLALAGKPVRLDGNLFEGIGISIWY